MSEELEMREKVIKGLEVVLNDIVDGYITEPNMACNTINDALALLKEPTQPTVPELKDLQVLRDVKSGKILKSGCKDYVIYNGDWYRQNRWDWPEKAQESRLLTAEEVAAMPFGHGWLEDWCVLENDDGSETDGIDVQRVGWADGTMAFKDSYSNLNKLLLLSYNQPRGFRIWIGENPPTDEQREATPWLSAENRDR